MASNEIQMHRDAMRERLQASGALVTEEWAKGDEALAQIFTELSQAESVDDVLAGGAAVPVEEILNQPLRIRSVRFLDGDFGPFAIMEADNLNTGEIYEAVACGGEIVVAQLLRLVEMEATKGSVFPIVAKFISRTTNAGFDVYRLVKAHNPIEAQATASL
jgi:hypothetical protein